MRPIKDITGQTFNKLTAIQFIRTQQERYSDGRNRTVAVWLWQCVCGEQIEAQARYVCRGFKKSCGCQVRRGDKVPAYNAYKKCYADGDLTFDQFYEMAQQNCYYCGSPPANRKTYHGHVYIYNGLNRIDHTKGHDLSNCRTCCWACNQRISNWSEEEFIKWIEKVYGKIVNKAT